jgi:CubicO group peptidase (beta-lactamase class C family)
MELPKNFEQDVETFIQKAMQAWNVPGLAAVVVKDNETIFAKGYGLREVGKPVSVDEHTLFAIGSNTKAFTATAIGLLVQDGKLEWDDPVTKHLPYFKMYDPHASDLLTVRDLLCHRSGLGTWAGDVLLYSSAPASEIVHRLRHLKPDFSFRGEYGYSNLMFIAAGEVIQVVSGMAWFEFVQKRIFEPLGMKDSLMGSGFLNDDTNVAVPHEDIKGKVQSIPYGKKKSNPRASGSILASVADISAWMKMQLNKGTLDGKRIINTDIIEETHTPQTPIRLAAIERELFPSRHFTAYGLGWFLSDIHGKFVIRHTGGVDGMLSSIVMIPEEKIGIAVFTNKLPNSAYAGIPHFITEKLLGVPAKDWVETYLEVEKREGEENVVKAARSQEEKNAARAKDTHPSLELEKYAGEYDNALLGGATIRAEGSGFHIQLKVSEMLSGMLEHWHYDSFVCKWDNPILGESLIPFITDGQGQVAEFRVKIREDWIDPVEHVFKKVN